MLCYVHVWVAPTSTGRCRSGDGSDGKNETVRSNRTLVDPVRIE
jgi:hypothetical protein